jgi:hypothetical protein
VEEKKPETPAQASPVPDQTASTTSEPAPAATEPSTETSPDATPEVQDATGGQAAPEKAGGEAPKKSSNGKIRNFISNLNLYLVLFIFIVIVAAVISAIAYLQGKKIAQKPTTQAQTLTPEKLKELSSNEIKVGDPKSLLTIESNTVFNGTTLIRGDLDVAGTIKVGGALSLPGISASGLELAIGSYGAPAWAAYKPTSQSGWGYDGGIEVEVFGSEANWPHKGAYATMR